MTWQKGKSGNPSGRPKVVNEVRDLARQYGRRALEAIAELAEKSSDDKVRLQAWDKLLDRGYGRPSQHIEADIRSDVAAVLEARRQRVLEQEEEPS